MPDAVARLERLLSNDLGECRADDVERRLDELGALRQAVEETAPRRRVFATLGDDTRYRIVRTLVAADDELCVCELDPIVDVSESAISHALSDLEDVGLVTRRKDGNWRYYEATPLANALLAEVDDD